MFAAWNNELLVTGPKTAWHLVWQQLAALLIGILILAAALSALLGDYLDAAAIGAIVFLNTLLGFVREYRAERAIQSLRKLTIPAVRVRRNTLVNEIPLN